MAGDTHEGHTVDFAHDMDRNEPYTNLRATETDVEFAMVIVGLFALVALIF